MINVLEIDGFHAVISFDPDINLFRGEFIDLNGGADFYATDVESLRREGQTSLKVFLDMCQEDGVAEGKSLNACTIDHLQHAVHD